MSAAAAGASAPAPPQRTLAIGGLEASLLSDEHFGALRTALGYDAWLPAALAAFDWGKMAAGGGKGGDKMARTPCKRLFVKEVSASDHLTLLHEGFLKARASAPACACGVHAGREGTKRMKRVARSPGALTRALQAYVARVASGKSLIVHIVAHARMPDGKVVMVMNNWLPVRFARGRVRSAGACVRAAARVAARRRTVHAAARRAGRRGGARRAAAAQGRVEASHGRRGGSASRRAGCRCVPMRVASRCCGRRRRRSRCAAAAGADAPRCGARAAFAVPVRSRPAPLPAACDRHQVVAPV